jgi:hypothetical protein
MGLIFIHKVAELPTILQPSSIYFVKPSGSEMVSIFITDKTAQSAYPIESGSAAVVEGEVLAVLNALRNEPGGFAGVDNNSLISTSIGIDGQDTPILTSDNGYVWKDMVSTFIVKDFKGGGNPKFGPIIGNIQGLTFEKDTMSQVWCDYHIEHDIALGTKIYPHIHWCPLTNKLGTVRWGIEWTIAKGHGQEAFTPPQTFYIEHTITEPSALKHFISEASDSQAILSSSIEPDAMLKLRVFRDGSSALDTHGDKIHAWMADIHYQAARIGTKNKAPNFYGNT